MLTAFCLLHNILYIFNDVPSHHCCHMGTAIKYPMPDRVKPSFVIFDIQALLTLSPENQSARISKITNDGLTRSGTGCFVGCTHMATVGVKGLNILIHCLKSFCLLCMLYCFIQARRAELVDESMDWVMDQMITLCVPVTPAVTSLSVAGKTCFVYAMHPGPVMIRC